jgi:dipeptidyl aminopeptidase/acylaminoacyl peptidase
MYLPGSAIAEPQKNRMLFWVDRMGKEEVIPIPPNGYKYPNISPDGNKIVLSITTGERWDNWIWDRVLKNLAPLNLEGKDNPCPVWSPDGKLIVFFSMGRRSGSDGVYWKASDGTGLEEQITDRPFAPYCWTDDGTLVGTVMTDALEITHIGTLSLEGDHEPKTQLSQASGQSPKVSPDGQWVAYSSNESGRWEIYVRPFPDVDRGGRWKVSTNGGGSPIWSPDGNQLFYLNGDAVMHVSVKTKPSFEIVGTPQVLFRGKFIGPAVGEGTPWDISSDGKRFLMIRLGEDTDEESASESPHKINIVLNFFEELKEKVPID